MTPHRYEGPTKEYLTRENNKFKDIIRIFEIYYGLEECVVDCKDEIVNEINNRIHQRRNYYWFFWDKDFAQGCRSATCAYWILHYRPLFYPNWHKNFNVNVYFAFFVIFNEAVGEMLEKYNGNIPYDIVMDVLVDNSKLYIRALSEYDISKESLMVIAQSIKSITELSIENHLLQQRLLEHSH